MWFNFLFPMLLEQLLHFSQKYSYIHFYTGYI